VRLKSKEKQPLIMTLVTESVIAASSPDTSGETHVKAMDGGICDESIQFKKRGSAFSYNSNLDSVDDGDKPYTSNESMGTLTSAMASAKRGRKKDRAQKQAVSWARKCVSCPEAARANYSELLSTCSDVSSRNDSRLAQSLNETMLREYRDEGSMRLDTTTLASADVYRFSRDCDNLETFISTTTYDANVARPLSPDSTDSTTSTVSSGSMDISTDEDSMNYDDVSLYRVSPIEYVTTEATAASLDVMPGPVKLTFVSYPPSPAAPAVTPRPQVPVRPQKSSCRMCRLDGLKYHPACPESVSVRGLLSGGTLTEGGTNTCELYVMKN